MNVSDPKHAFRSYVNPSPTGESQVADWEPARGMPCEDVENIRPETQAIVQIWL